ncbi:MAG: 3-hydroxyacyl-CoA dehydrogenase family protein [Elusimicrobiaceae bacterium]|nr:3-hydroxyacyl-CoA dehydrogenase family protein [Elusimicrobiaceae bacterium]
MPVTAIGIIGSCAQSTDLALRSAEKGMQVRIYDVARSALNLAMARVDWTLRKSGNREIAANIEPVQKLDKLAGADIVIEAGNTSQERFLLFRKLEEVMGSSGIICIRCGHSDPFSVIGEVSTPDRFVGMNLAEPVSVNRFAELARFEKTSDETLDLAVEYLKKLGKEPLVGRYSAGMISGRLLYMYILAGIVLLEKGRGLVHEIDSAVRENMKVPAGPFELVDRFGIDSFCGLGAYIYKSLGQPERFAPPKTADRLNQYGECGRRSGLGFYVYEEGQIAGINPRLKDIVKYLGLSEALPGQLCAEIFSAVATEAKLVAADAMVSEYDVELAVRMAFGWPKGPSGMAKEAGESVVPGASGELQGDLL